MGGQTKLQARQVGFTLIELMVVVTIVAILMAVALPAFNSQMMKGHRAAAQAEMMEIANKQQQYLLSNRAYTTTLIDIGYSLPTDVGDRYTPAIDNSTCAPSPCFTITFTAKDSQVDDGGPLTLNHLGEQGPMGYWN